MKTKRTIAALLCALMLCSSMSLSFASEDTYANKDDAITVAKVNAARIMTGTDLGFEPNKNLTRAEAATIIVRMKGYSEETVKSFKGETLFNDVASSHWASGYINIASNFEIVNGIGDNLFAPESLVTIAEFETMAIRALGAGKLVDSQGEWPINYINFANEENILKDINSIHTSNATRLDAATIVCNSLEIPMWIKSKVTTGGTVTWVKSSGVDEQTILEDVLHLSKVTYDITDVSVKEHRINDNIDVSNKFDLTNVKVGLTYHGYYDNDEKEITGLWIEDDSIEFNGVADKFNASKKEIKLKVNDKVTTYKVADNAKLFINEDDIKTPGQDPVYYSFSELDKANDSIFGSIILNSNNEISAMYITCYTNYGLVRDINKSTIRFDNKLIVCNEFNAPSSLKWDDEDKEYFFTKDDKAYDLKDLKVGDIICYYTYKDKVVGKVITNDVTGKVSSISLTSNTIKLDSTKYEIKTFDNFAKLDEEIKVVLDNGKDIVCYQVIEKESNIAFITYLREIRGKYGKDYEVNLLFTDGTTKEGLIVNLEDTFDEFFETANVDGKFYYQKHSFTGINDEPCLICGLYKHDYVDNSGVCDACGDDESKHSHNDFCNIYLEEDATTSEKEEAIRTFLSLAKKQLTLDGEFQGTVMGYELNGDNEVTLKADIQGDIDYINNGHLTVTKKHKFLDSYHLKDDTRIFKIKEDDEYQVKYEEIDINEIDDMDITTAIVVGIDDRSYEVDYVFLGIDNVVKRNTEKNFVFITDVAETKYKNKDAYEVEGYNLDGKLVSYIYQKDYADFDEGFNESDITALYDLVVKDGLIKDIRSHDEEGEDCTYEIAVGEEFFIDRVLDYRIVTHLDDDIILADKLLVLEHIDDEYIVSSLEDIEEYDEDSNTNDQVIICWTYEEDVDNEAILIVFEEVNE